MEDGMKLRELLQLLKRRWITIFITALFISVSITATALFVLKPTYQFSTQIVLTPAQQENPAAPYNDRANVQLIASYIDIIKSPVIMESVIKELKLKRSVYDLQEQISVVNRENSQVISIVVTDKNAEMVKKISYTIASIAQGKMKELMKTENFKPLLEEGSLEKPEIVFPKKAPTIAISLIVGLLVGVCLAFLRDYLNDSAGLEGAVENSLDALGYKRARFPR